MPITPEKLAPAAPADEAERLALLASADFMVAAGEFLVNLGLAETEATLWRVVERAPIVSAQLAQLLASEFVDMNSYKHGDHPLVDRVRTFLAGVPATLEDGYPPLPAGSTAYEFDGEAVVYEGKDMHAYVAADRALRGQCKEAAVNTLQSLGYTYHGAEQWKPPTGKAPDFDLVDQLRALQEEKAALQDVAGQAVQLLQEVHREFVVDGHGGEFDPGEHQLADRVRTFLIATPTVPAPAAIDPGQCAQDVFDKGVSVGLFDIPKATANALCAGISTATGARVDWHYIGGRVHVKVLPAVAVHEEFSAWLARAYRQPQEAYTISNMEVAYAAGKAATGAPVVMPDPVGWRHSLTMTLHETLEEVSLADADEHAEALYTEQQVRALLAGVSAPADSPGFDNQIQRNLIGNAGSHSEVIDKQAAGAAQAVVPFDQWWSNGGGISVAAMAIEDGWRGAAEAGYNAALRAPQAAATQAVPTEQQILDAAEKAGLWPNTVHTWIPAFKRYHAALAVAQEGQDAPSFEQRLSDWQHGDAEDAQLFRWLREIPCVSLHLSRNDPHACNYMTARQWIEEQAERFDDVPAAELQAMKDTNTIWSLQIYPNTPVGFNVWHGATLGATIRAAAAASAPQGE